MNITSRIRPAAWAGVAILILVHIGLVWILRSPDVLTGHDDAQYLLLARSLQDFEYKDIFRTDAANHRMYPPGYPAALAVWGLFTRNDFDRLVLLTIASSAASLLLFFFVVARLWSSRMALLTVGVVALNPYIVDNGGTIASEAPYMFLSMIAVWLSGVAVTSKERRNSILAILAALGAALTRAVGATVLVAVGLVWLFKRQWRPLAALAILSAITLSAWFAWTIASPEQFVGRSYIADAVGEDLNGAILQDGRIVRMARNISERVTTNIPRYLTSLVPSRLVVPTIPDTPVDNAISAIVLTATLLVGFFVVFKKWLSLAVYLACYGAVLVIWNWPVGRFLDPVLPAIVLTILSGAGAIASWFNARWSFRASLALALFLAATSGVATAELVRTRIDCQEGLAPNLRGCLTPQQRAFFMAMDYTRDKLPKDAIFFTGKPATLYYYTGRPSISRYVAESQNSQTFTGYLREAGVDFLLIGDLHTTEEHVSYLMESDCSAYAVEAIFPGTYYLFRLLDNGAPATDNRACAVIEDYHRSIAEKEKRPLHPERLMEQSSREAAGEHEEDEDSR